MFERPDDRVEVVPYDDRWIVVFDEARRALEQILGDVAWSVEHIGSTAVPGLAAKPTIDVLVVVESIEQFVIRLPELERLGFDHRAANTMVAHDDSLFLRRVSDGKRTHHLHVVDRGSAAIDGYRLFRDALRQDKGLADEYQQLKLRLAAAYPSDRTRYVAEKSSWVDSRMTDLRRSPPS